MMSLENVISRDLGWYVIVNDRSCSANALHRSKAYTFQPFKKLSSVIVRFDAVEMVVEFLTI